MINYEQHLAATAQSAQTSAGANQSGTKVGFLKLPNDGSEALVRINYGSVSEFMMTSYHQLDASQKYMKIECLAPQGTYGSTCPLCTAAASNPSISKAKTRIFVPMLAAYREASGVLSAPVPVIWDAAANARQDYAKALATKLADFGNLRDHVFILRRHGTGLDTSYSIDYVPSLDSEEYVPKDFSAFANFNIAKHSYWVKSLDEITTFLTTGSFPQYQKQDQSTVSVPKTAAPTAATAGSIPVKIPDTGYSNYTTPTPAAIPTPTETPAPIPMAAPAPVEPTPEPVATPEPTPATPGRNFGGGFGSFLGGEKKDKFSW